jgi:hypothetical protein
MNPALDQKVPSFGDALGGLALGACCGAGMVSGTVLILGLMGGGPDVALLFTILALPIAWFLWMIGLLVIGVPGWALLHLLGLTSRWVGAAFGGVATTSTSLLLADELSFLPIDPHDAWTGLIVNACWLGAMGAVVGWIIIKTAYRLPRAAS